MDKDKIITIILKVLGVIAVTGILLIVFGDWLTLWFTFLFSLLTTKLTLMTIGAIMLLSSITVIVIIIVIAIICAYLFD